MQGSVLRQAVQQLQHAQRSPYFALRAGWQQAGSVAFSTDSHDDFKPQSKAGSFSSDVFEAIKQDIHNNDVMLYMKGYPDQPMCGFSARVVALLRGYGKNFESRNVLEDNELREGIKKFSNWPTIPQVYANGEFIGGCDVLWEAHEAGEFEALFK